MNKLEFFETKVIKVKKEKGVSHHCNKWFTCPICGKKLSHNYKGEKEKGNFVNGENLDKIKFPCFCSFSDPILKDCRYGMIINEGYFNNYLLVEVKTSGQSDSNMVRDKASRKALKDLIQYWDIHILKGKIIIFDFEKESK